MLEGLRRIANNSLNGTPPTPPSSRDSDADITTTQYARKCRQLMELHRSLSELLPVIPLNLPRLAVIGGQSTGKSSLLEEISGISVPRDSGTCTRCPMECTLSTGEESWSCCISLRISYNPDGSSTGTSNTIDFGPIITDKKEVEIWIRRAQAAVLNPDIEESVFLSKTESELKNEPNALLFSKNVVCVHVSDRNLTDLSFIDLPGLIQNSDENDISLIRNMVMEAISESNTLILVTIPMTDDIQNQAAVRLAKDVDPDGERTIGILTKPDGVSSGETGHLAIWKGVIEGKQYPLKHGYYCVRLPNDTERAKYNSRNDFQNMVASRFFETTAPWNAIADRNRFGIANFVTSISELLIERIEGNLPELEEKARQLLYECEDEIVKLPSVDIGNPSTEVFVLVSEFCFDFRSAIIAENERGKQFVQRNKSRYEKFKEDVYTTRPNFVPYGTQYPREFDREPEKHRASSPPVDLANVKQSIASSRGWELQTHVPYDVSKNLMKDSTKLWTRVAFSCLNDVSNTCSELLKDLVKEHFGHLPHLTKHVNAVIQQELEICKEEAKNDVKKVLELEDFPLYTQNTSLLFKEKLYWLKEYYNTRFHRDTPSQDPCKNTDEDYDALAVMAEVRAYFHVAHMRFIDYIPLIIERTLHRSLVTELQSCLFGSLQDESGATDGEAMKALLVEDPAVVSKREVLEDRREMLEKIRAKFEAFRQEG